MEPLTREYLRGLKTQRDESERIKLLDKWIKTIYEYTHYYAERNSETYYKFVLQYHLSSVEFLKENMGTILGKIQDLFPDSRVIYNSSYNLLGEIEEEYILIDWS